ncbi:putative outer membrane starch-binding protein [Leeuwenhoekiella aestuarii]|uniref:Putative outer membrane starch-binding protein n=1 Tax=Leeuwenhoekiella aestuarii TaxID=2249426 RepID=A0A4Q0NR83_9FLAO|nr:RagB/SusD family nutrient uptake outer membrane protein [Leeuwenhoekiella aestuarii]RXG11704.1 putative outer membrane starch-binding protein [Leeuwenhoekiella aestuarii]RXG12759.1 putative outer membrane starch-binding protein [Leeuwenhoekiella aestuarii]
MKRTKQIKLVFLSFLTAAAFTACTDLEIEETDSILTDGFTGIPTADEAASTVSGMYNNIQGYVGDQANLYALSEVTTDAQLVPTRGSDWGDNGIWRQMHQHTWTADHQYIRTVFDQWNELQLTSSTVLDERSASSDESRAQASFLRALGMFVILDNFGQVPFRDTTADPRENPEVLTGADAVSFIVSDLQNAISGLPSSSAGDDNPRATKAAARYLLAKVHLNRHIYEKTGSPASSDMNEVITLVEEIEDDGYALEDGYFEMFEPTPDSETIWYINTSTGNRIWNTLHYNFTHPDNTGGGWNGFATLAEYYDLFEGPSDSNNPGEGQEERRGYVAQSGIAFTGQDLMSDTDNDGFADASNVGYGFLIGQQYALNGDELTDRGNVPLQFKRDFVDAGTGEPSLVENGEQTGIRVIKYNPRNGAFREHEIFFRYSDAYLMKIEAIHNGGTSSDDALTLMNDLRTLRDATPLTSLTDQDIIDERGRELYIEFWRRNDLIRFGQYTKDWAFKDPSAVGNDEKNLFPIPNTQVILNPNLVQNPGY